MACNSAPAPTLAGTGASEPSTLFKYSEYLGSVGLGGVFGGSPPAHAGILSANVPASHELIDPQPLSSSAAATATAQIAALITMAMCLATRGIFDATPSIS